MPAVPANPPILVVLVAPDNAGLDALRPAAETLETFGIGWEPIIFPSCAPCPRIERGRLAVIAASDDGNLPATLAKQTGLPVIRVPMSGSGVDGLPLVFDETGNLPAGKTGDESFATVAIGAAGAKNAALLVVSVLALTDSGMREKWHAFRARQTEAVLAASPLQVEG